MYSKDDIVMYATQGVCRITDITTKEICGRTIEYYVLKPIYSETALLYVPVANQKVTSKLRRVLSKDEIIELIQSLRSTEVLWIENEQQRKEKYKELIDGSDRRGLIEMIKSLYIHQKMLNEQGKKLHLVDERFFKEAEKILYDEFALVLNIKTDEVIPFIASQLEINN